MDFLKAPICCGSLLRTRHGTERFLLISQGLLPSLSTKQKKKRPAFRNKLTMHSDWLHGRALQARVVCNPPCSTYSLTPAHRRTVLVMMPSSMDILMLPGISFKEVRNSHWLLHFVLIFGRRQINWHCRPQATKSNLVLSWQH